MLIVDAQIHLWEKGTPSAHHRQEPYSAEEAIAGMDAAAVDRALIHPVLWDPASNELAVEAVRRYPERFAIMGWFYLDDPYGRGHVAHWKERPGMLGLRFYTNERQPPILVHRRHARLAVGRRRARAGTGGAWRGDVSADGGQDRRASPRPEADRRSHGRAARQQGRGGLSPPAGIADFGQIPECGGQGDRASGLRRGRISVPQPASAPASLFRRLRPRAHVLGHRHHPHVVLLAPM